MTNPDDATSPHERDDLVASLRQHRDLFLRTTQGMTDDQARERSTVSELTLGGLVKHVADTERGWASFVADGPAERTDVDWSNIDWADPPPEVAAYADGFRMTGGETLESLLAAYAEVAAATDALVAGTDLDATQPLPEAPWFEPGARWSARRVFLHVLAETSQHAGHADIIREAIDGQKSMG